MSCMENIVVYIPKGACVKTVPVRSLSSSTARKISASRPESDKETPGTVTWICPVELRGKDVAVGKDTRRGVQPLTKITPGQFLLPVVSSSITAFKVLRAVLKTHKPEVQFSERETEAPSLEPRACVGRNAIIVHDGQIFLSVRRSRLQDCPSSPPGVCPASSGQHQQIKPSSGCQDQPLPDTSASQHGSISQDVQTPVRDHDINTQISPLLDKLSEETPEQSRTSKDCQKKDEPTSESRPQKSPPNPPEHLESSQEASSMDVSVSQPNILQQPQIPHTSSSACEQPEAEPRQDDSERLEAARLPRAESCLAFDFEQLAQEERINHLRARLRQKEAALSIFTSKPTKQI